MDAYGLLRRVVDAVLTASAVSFDRKVLKQNLSECSEPAGHGADHWFQPCGPGRLRLRRKPPGQWPGPGPVVASSDSHARGPVVSDLAVGRQTSAHDLSSGNTNYN